MDEYAANGSPEMLNRAIGYNREMLQGVIWAARNRGGTGNLMLDAASAARGLGVGYTALPSFTGVGMIGDDQRLQAQIDAARAEVRNTQHLPMDNRAAQARLDELLKQQEAMRAQNNEAMRQIGGLWEFGGQQMPYLPDAIGGSYTAFSPKGEQTSTPFGQLNVPAGESTGELRAGQLPRPGSGADAAEAVHAGDLRAAGGQRDGRGDLRAAAGGHVFPVRPAAAPGAGRQHA